MTYNIKLNSKEVDYLLLILDNGILCSSGCILGDSSKEKCVDCKIMNFSHTLSEELRKFLEAQCKKL